MIKRIVHQATAFGLASVFTISILSSIHLLAVQPGEPGVMAAERAASQVAQTAQVSTAKNVGG